jgi:hypothetical protein
MQMLPPSITAYYAAMSSAPHRLPWTVLIVLCALWLGLIAGTAIGARFVPAGIGFASAPTALGYGAVGALASAVLAGVLAVRLPVRTLRTCALVALGLALGLLAFLGYRVHLATA